MRIYISTWGNPKHWRYAEYTYQGYSAKAFSTLNLAASSPELKADLALVLTLDTLASVEEGVKQGEYKDVVNDVKRFVEKYLCVEGGENIVDVVILPGIMGRIDNKEFRGNPEDLGLRALQYIYTRSLKKALERGDCPIEAIVDTTHGINYFTVLISGVVYEALASLSVATVKTIPLRVFNADPLPPGQGGPRSKTNPCIPDTTSGEQIPVLQFNPIREDIVSPWDLVRYLKYKGDVQKLLSDERPCGIDSIEKIRVIHMARRIVASYRVGAILELATMVSLNKSWGKEAESLMQRAENCWLDNARIVEERGVLRVLFGTRFMSGFRLLLHAHAVYTGINRLLGDGLGNERTRQPGEFTLRYIKDIAEKILRGSEVTYSLIMHEIGNLKTHSESTPLHDWTPYSRLSDKDTPQDKPKDSAPEDICEERAKNPSEIQKYLSRLKRNFIAHAGFLKDIIEVKKENEEILLRIREGCLELVYGILDEIFKDLRAQN